MIKAINLQKGFGEKAVLRDINITFAPGQANLIIGKSGSGKTVLLKILAGLITPDNGRILFEEQNVAQMSKRERQRIQQKTGMLFQDGALFDSLSVGQNVMFPLRLHTKLSEKEAMRRALSCLDRVNLKESFNQYPGDLSGGMRKRVAIARAIANKPKFLFCDEPNSGLDPQTSLLIDNLIHSITHDLNITTIVNTHDMNSVLGIGDHVAFLSEGYLIWEGKGSDILTTHDEALNRFVFATPLAQKILEHQNKELRNN
ncbi:MAG: ABC transporter ATP-binding protein [Bacteroides sp.]